MGGEVEILQEHLKHFLDMAEDLGIQGLRNLDPKDLVSQESPMLEEENNLKSKSEQVVKANQESEGVSPRGKSEEGLELPGLMADFVDRFASEEIVKFETLAELPSGRKSNIFGTMQNLIWLVIVIPVHIVENIRKPE